MTQIPDSPSDEQDIQAMQEAFNVLANDLIRFGQVTFEALCLFFEDIMLPMYAIWDALEPAHRSLYAGWLMQRGCPKPLAEWLSQVPLRRWLPPMRWLYITIEKGGSHEPHR